MPTTTLSVIEQRKAEIVKRLRKRDKKSLHDLAEEIGHGCTVKHLTRAMSALVVDGVAVRHRGRPPEYSKA